MTAGNSCGINDGAAAVAIVDAERTRPRSACPGCGCSATATAGVDPSLPGPRPGAGGRAALDAGRAGASTTSTSVEITEAFAGAGAGLHRRARPCDPRPQVCAEGGAIALGHPWGASGAVLVVRLFAPLVRAGRGRLGLAACAVGGGQGVAMVVERCR